jgi:hypothetical protein
MIICWRIKWPKNKKKIGRLHPVTASGMILLIGTVLKAL